MMSYSAIRFALRCCCVRARCALPALAQEAPDALVKRVSQEVLQIIKHRSQGAGRRPGSASAR